MRPPGKLATAHFRTVLLIPVDGCRIERFDHIRAGIGLQQRVALFHELDIARTPLGIVVELVFDDQRHTTRHYLEHVGEQWHMLEIPFRSAVRCGDQRRIFKRTRQRRCHSGTGGVGREQRDAGQLIVREIGDTARISGDAHQIAVMHHHDFAVGGHLQVKLDAIAGFASRCECRKRVLRSDRTSHAGAAIAGLHGHATCQRHILAALVGILRGQTGTRVMQATMRVPHVGNGRHIVAALVGEGTRRDRPHCGACSDCAAEQRLVDE